MTIITYLLTQNRYSRNGKKMGRPKGIVLHDAMNEGYSAIAERNYLDNLKLGKNAIYYSTHYVIGINGEIINCVPENEVSYHRGNSIKSEGHISIEYCALNANEPLCYAVKTSLKQLVIDIAARYNLNINECFLRHSDEAEKKCPRFYAENDRKWAMLKDEIVKEAEIYKYLSDNNVSISEKLTKTIGADNNYIRAILTQKIAPDAITIAGLINKII